jgi:hypothetical protein
VILDDLLTQPARLLHGEGIALVVQHLGIEALGEATCAGEHPVQRSEGLTRSGEDHEHRHARTAQLVHLLDLEAAGLDQARDEESAAPALVQGMKGAEAPNSSPSAENALTRSEPSKPAGCRARRRKATINCSPSAGISGASTSGGSSGSAATASSSSSIPGNRSSAGAPRQAPKRSPSPAHVAGVDLRPERSRRLHM